MSLNTQALKDYAHQLGFNLVGLTPATPSPHLDAYLQWVANGMHADMGYLARADRLQRRQDLNVILPDVRSLIIVGMDYRAAVPESLLQDPSRGRIAAYAWHLDYHDILTEKLQTLAAWIQAPHRHKVYVDTGAILERSHAQQAGLGFIGKNTLLIHPRRGSYFFLGEILSTLEFDAYDSPHRETQCGHCTRCLHACPTDAFPQPYTLDARRCISYHTIENKGWITHDLRARFGNWIYGCDVCQEVCPWQRFTHTTSQSAFIPPDEAAIAPPLLTLLALTPAQFEQRYRYSPIQRIRYERFMRNVCIAVGNWRNPQALTGLTPLLTHESALIRGHAGWAYAQIAGRAALPTLTQMLAHEPNDACSQDLQKTRVACDV